MNYGTIVPKNFRPPGRNFHRVELSFPGTFVPGNFRSQGRMFHGTFVVPWNFRYMEHPSPVTFVPGDKKFLENMLSSVYLLTYKKVTFSNGVTFMQTNISVSFTVISELQWNETSIKYSNLANIIHWCGTLNPKVSSNNNGKTTEVPPSEHNYTNPICQYSIAISDTE